MELTTILLLIFSILTLLALAAVLVLLAVPRRPKGLTDLERELRRDLQSFGDMITDNQHDANMLQEQRFANFERASGTRLETLSDKVQRMSDGVSETQQRAAQAQEQRFASFEKANEQRFSTFELTNEQKLEQIRQTMERRLSAMQQSALSPRLTSSATTAPESASRPSPGGAVCCSKAIWSASAVSASDCSSLSMVAYELTI